MKYNSEENYAYDYICGVNKVLGEEKNIFLL